MHFAKASQELCHRRFAHFVGNGHGINKNSDGHYLLYYNFRDGNHWEKGWGADAIFDYNFKHSLRKSQNPNNHIDHNRELPQ